MTITWPFQGLNPHVVSQTSTTVTVGWTADPNACGYRFSVDGTVVSHTWNENLAQTRFKKPADGQQHVYEIEQIYAAPGEKVTA